MGQMRMFHTSQWGDERVDEETYWQLSNDVGTVIASGDSSGTTGSALGNSVYMSKAGKYTLDISYDGFYAVVGQLGSIATTLGFDNSKTDANPPYLKRFKVLSESVRSDYLMGGLVNTVEFELIDDDAEVASATLLVRPLSQLDYQEVALTVAGTKYTAVIPDLAVDGFVAMKLIATDTTGNTLTTEWDLAFYHQTNSGAPVADAGIDQQLTADFGNADALAVLDGSASYDPDGQIATYVWKEGGVILGNSDVINAVLTVGTHDITLTVTDNDGFTASDMTRVVVDAAMVAPVADAGGDVQIDIEFGSLSALVELDGSASSDADGQIVTYLWKEGEVVLGTGAVIEADLTIGTHDITLTVTDDDGLSSMDTTQVIVSEKPFSGAVIHVNDIKMTAAKKGRNWTVTAEVTIIDDSSNPVKSVDIFANWGGAVIQSTSEVTYSKGKKRIGTAKFTLSRIKEAGTFTFTVVDVTKSGTVYDAALNVETSDTVVIQ